MNLRTITLSSLLLSLTAWTATAAEHTHHHHEGHLHTRPDGHAPIGVMA